MTLLNRYTFIICSPHEWLIGSGTPLPIAINPCFDFIMNYFDFVNAFASTFVIVIIDYNLTEKWDITIRKRKRRGLVR